MIAAAGANVIYVYDFHTGDKITDMRGHNGKVRSFTWSESGAHLLSSGQDGAIYLWDLSGQRVGDFVNKGVNYSAAALSGGSNSVFAIGNDGKLIELEAPELLRIGEPRPTDHLMGTLALSVEREVLLAGTADAGKPGTIRTYAYPLSGDFTDLTCLAGPVTKLCLTPDLCFLVATDEMGTLIEFDFSLRALFKRSISFLLLVLFFFTFLLMMTSSSSFSSCQVLSLSSS